jgi:hypothetical protein
LVVTEVDGTLEEILVAEVANVILPESGIILTILAIYIL